MHALAYLNEIAKANTVPPKILTINWTNWGGGKLVILPFFIIIKIVIRIKA